MKNVREFIWPVIGLLAVVVSGWLLYRELRGMSLDDVWDSLTAVPAHRYALAAPLDPRRLCGAGLVRPHRSPASGRAPHFVAVRVDHLVHDLCAVAQHRRLGLLRRARALSRLYLEGPERPADRGAGGPVLLHLRARHHPARRVALAPIRLCCTGSRSFCPRC